MKNTKKIGLGLLPLIAFIGFFFMQSRSAAAFVATSAQQVQDATFQFVDRGLIKANIGGQEVDFVDGKPFDTGISFSAQNYDCSATINPPDDMFSLANLGNYPSSLPTKYIHIQYDDGSGSGCQNGSVTTAPTGADVGMRTWFDWADSATIKRIDNGATFTKSPSADYYLDESEAGKSCQDRIFVNGDSGQYFQLDSNKGLSASSTNAKSMSLSGCRIYGYNFQNFTMLPSSSAFNSAFAHSFTLGTPENKANAAGSSVAAQSASGDDTPSCESNFNTGFEWILCPALRIADSAAGAFNGFIEGQLNVCTGVSSTTGQTCNDNNLTDQVKKVWSIFRLLSSLGLVVALLVMVISEAIGFGMFDAYTIRKTLPKIVIAVVLIQLSWVMFKFFIDLSNDLGTGIRDIMLAPFGGSNAVSLDKLVGHKVHASTGSGVGADAFSVFALLAGLAVAWVTLPGIFTLAFMVVFSLLTAFVTLIFRKLLIIVLVILSPIALICWILPGLDKYWKLWLTNYEKLLLMFPMIMALIAGGRMFAYITSGNQAGGVSSFAELAIVVVAYFGPYFLLPKTYAWGGQFMQMGANAIKGGIDKIKAKPMEYAKNRGESWREERRQKSKERVAEGKYFTKNPLSLFTGTADKFKSGQWDPLLGRRAVTIGGRTFGSDSRRRERAITAYKAGGAQAEEEDLKNAKLSNELEYSRQDEADAENFQRLKAEGKIAEVDEHGKIVYQKDANGRDLLDAEGNKQAVIKREATVMEQRAALDKLAVLGGEGNMAVIQSIHDKVLQSGTTEQKRMMTKYKDANAQSLFKKLPHLYKNYTYATDGEVHRTVDGLVPEDMTTLSGTAFAAMRDTLVRNIAANPNDARSIASLKRLMTVLQQASEDENIKGHINADVARRGRELSVGDVGLSQLQAERQALINRGENTTKIDAQISTATTLQAQIVSAQTALMRDPEAAHVLAEVSSAIQEGTGIVTGGAPTVSVPAGPGTNIPAGGVTIPHNAPEARIVSATDFDLQNWANSVGGWDNISDDELVHVYNYRSGAIKDAAEQALRRKGLIS